jgi:spermidine synthase
MGSKRFSHNRRIAFAIATAGATGLASQIVLMREFFEVFYGNELSIGFVLATWLVASALGSMAIGRLSADQRHGPRLFVLSQMLLAVVAPSSIYATRFIKPFFGIPPGQLVGIGVLLVSALVILSPLCLIAGSLFTLGCQIYKSSQPHTRSSGTFLFESIGAVCGGLFVSLFLIRFFTTLEIAPLIALANLVSAYLLSSEMREAARERLIVRGIAMCLMVLVSLGYLSGAYEKLDLFSLQKEFPHFEIAKSRTSVYGHTVVVRRGGETSFFTNGIHAFSYPDRLTSEETVHFPMLLHKGPKNVLLIGGGTSGTLDELLKYPVLRIDYVELDPAIIELARETLGDSSARALRDPKVRIIHMDGRLYIKETKAKYDVILIDLPNPYTAQINRFYTREFYREIYAILNEGGIVSFASAASESYIGLDLSRFLSSLYRTAKDVFPDVAVIPGNRVIFLLSNRIGATTFDVQRLIDRLREKGIKTDYVRDYYLLSRLSRENRSYLNSRLSSGDEIKPNLDFSPISYYYDLVLWASYFKDIFCLFLRNLRGTWLWYAFACVVGFMLAIGPWVRAKPRILCAIGLVGFTQITFQIILMLIFQILYGYMYFKLGLMVSLFMAGLSLGSFLMMRGLDRIERPFSLLCMLVLAVILYLGLTILLVPAVQNAQSHPLARRLGEVAVSSVLPIISGTIGGALFPLASKMYLQGLHGKRADEASGVLYGIDLIGSAIGALFASSILIPIIGIYQTCAMVLIVNIAVLGVLRMPRAAE